MFSEVGGLQKTAVFMGYWFHLCQAGKGAACWGCCSSDKVFILVGGGPANSRTCVSGQVHGECTDAYWESESVRIHFTVTVKSLVYLGSQGD